MGGLGSGRWNRDDQKTAVESCYSLDVNELARKGMLCDGAAGFMWWIDEFGENPFCLEFSSVHDDRGEPDLLLSYRWYDWWDDEPPEDISFVVPLQTTRPYFGGLRWWFTCPLEVADGNPCNRRVGKLYLPSDARYFGCRHCYDLVYRPMANLLEHAKRRLKVHRKQMERLRKKHGS